LGRLRLNFRKTRNGRIMGILIRRVENYHWAKAVEDAMRKSGEK
jgi:hypothetical protein